MTTLIEDIALAIADGHPGDYEPEAKAALKVVLISLQYPSEDVMNSFRCASREEFIMAISQWEKENNLGENVHQLPGERG